MKDSIVSQHSNTAHTKQLIMRHMTKKTWKQMHA